MTESTLEPDSADNSLPAPMVGTLLRAAREARGQSVLEVALVLKLGERQVRALEESDWPSLPGITFVRGFVRNYARLLELDPVPLMEQLGRQFVVKAPEIVVPEAMHASMPASSGKPQRRDYLLAAFGLILVVAAALVYFFMPNDISSVYEDTRTWLASVRRPATPPEPVPSVREPVLPPGATLTQVLNPQSAQAIESAASPSPPAVAPTSTPTPTPVERLADAAPSSAPSPVPSVSPEVSGTVALLHFSFQKDSWIDVRDRRGNVIWSQMGRQGGEKDVEGLPPFNLKIGNATGVSLKFRGQNVDLAPHTRGDVARLTLE